MGKTSVKEVNEAWKLAFKTPRNSRTFGRFSLVNVKVLGTKNQVFNDKNQNHFSQCTLVYPCPTYIARQRFQNPLSTLNPSLFWTKSFFFFLLYKYSDFHPIRGGTKNGGLRVEKVVLQFGEIWNRSVSMEGWR